MAQQPGPSPPPPPPRLHTAHQPHAHSGAGHPAANTRGPAPAHQQPFPPPPPVNPSYCPTCKVKCHGPAGWKSHTEGGRHRGMELLLALQSGSELTVDKGGVEVLPGSFPVVNIVPGTTMEQIMWITNKLPDSQIISSISQLKPCDGITLTSVTGGITVNQPESQLLPGQVPTLLNPQQTLRVTISISPGNVGMLRTMFLVRLVTGITIGRLVEVCCDVALDPTLPSIAAAAPYVAPPKPNFTPAVEIIRAEKPRFAVTQYKFQLGYHHVPDMMRRLVLGENGGIGMAEVRRQIKEMAGIPDARTTTVAAHVRKMHALLHLEELQQELDIRNYDMREAVLTGNGRTLLLKVPGLAESRPSVMKGDRLFVRPASSLPGSREFEGYVHHVEELEVSLQFDARFYVSHLPQKAYHVRFNTPRTNFRLMHEAASVIGATFTMAAGTLLPATKPPKTGWIPYLRSAGALLLPASLQPFARSSVVIRKWYKPDLNAEQRDAVQNIVWGSHAPAPYIVFGPPGTGKTSVLIEAALQLVCTPAEVLMQPGAADAFQGIPPTGRGLILALDPKAKLLLCAPSNSAADQLAVRLLASRPASEMVRLNAYQRSVQDVHPELMRREEMCPRKREAGQEGFVLPSVSELTRRGLRVVVCTAIMAIKLRCQGIPSHHFTHVLMDEAGHAEEPLSLGPMAAALGARIVLAGDPQQLGPVVLSKHASSMGLQTSMLERLTADSQGPYTRTPQPQQGQGQGPPAITDAHNPVYITKLLRNYRSHARILALPNKLFYGGELQPLADPIITHCMMGWEELPNPHFPMLFHAVEGKDERENNSPSWFNIMEVGLVLDYVRKLKAYRKARLTDADIGVITPYRKQVERIRKVLSKDHGQVKVGSVEEFQGQERKVIVISTVRSSTELLDFDLKHRLGFVANPKRFNVSVTRAKSLVILIGNPHVLACDPHWRELLQTIMGNSGCRGSSLPASLSEDNAEDAHERETAEPQVASWTHQQPLPPPPPVNPYYCLTCKVNCTGPVGWRSHTEGSQHRGRELMAALQSGSGLVLDKGGLTVMWITNTAASSLIISSITQLKPCDGITLTSVVGGETVNPTVAQPLPGHVPILLQPSGTLRVTISISPGNVGMLRTMFMVRLVTGITIGRLVEVCCDVALDPTLPSIAAAAPFVAAPRPDFTPASVIIRAEKPRFAITSYRNRLGQYPVPQAMRQLVLGENGCISLSEVRRGLQEMAGMAGAQLRGIPGHINKMHALLHLEELQQELDIRKYDMRKAVLTGNGRTLLLKVPGLAESRPSVMKGDKLFVRLATASPGSPEFEGYVHRVEELEVSLQFGESFYHSHLPAMEYHVRFNVPRTNFRLMHEAACVLGASTMAAGTLLPATRPPQGGWLPFLKSAGALLLPPSLQPFVRSSVVIRSWYRRDLNTEQKDAVQNIFWGSHAPAPYIVFGPPGTGKTSVLIEAAIQILALDPKAKLLLCAPLQQRSRPAGGQASGGQTRKRDGERGAVRVNAYQRSVEDVHPELMKRDGLCPWEQDGDQKGFLLPSVAQLTRRGLRVVVCTALMAIKAQRQGIPSHHFTHVLMDEAGHAEEPLSMGPMAAALGARFVLAGDPQQLGPVVLSRHAASMGLQTSLLERLTATEQGPYTRTPPLQQEPALPAAVLGAYNPVYITKLVQTYRSHALILALPNKLFYGGELQPLADPIITHCMMGWEELPNPHFPMLFHAVEGKDERENNSPSWFNIMEVGLVLDYVRKLKAYRRARLTDADIGVITPYRKQVERMRKVLSKDHGQVKVGSVEEFQGQERKVIVISTVRSSTELLDFDLKHRLGFVANPKRFNVSITRAKSLVILVGNPCVLACDPHWRQLLQTILANNGCCGSSMPASILAESPQAAQEKDLAGEGKYQIIYCIGTAHPRIV
ncbi:MAG: hypothetical protein WDW38_010981 [Sanguina aurantia]